MSTRSAVGFRYGGQDFLEYHHSDSYPTGLGLEMLEAFRDQSVDALKAFGEKLRLVEGDDKPGKAGVLKFYPSLGGMGTAAEVQVLAGRDEGSDWCSLVEPFVGEPAKRLAERNAVIVDYRDYLFDRGCEWAYILDLDVMVFEMYTQHFTTTKKKEHHGERLFTKPDKRLAAEFAKRKVNDEFGERDRAPHCVAKVSLEELQALPAYALTRFCERMYRLH